MSDPVSLAGTAVGVISLGIQACQGPYDYISAIQSRGKDLDALSRQIQSLNSAFQALKVVIPKVESLPRPNATAIDALQKCVTNCEHGVGQLQEQLKSLQKTTTKDVKGRIIDAGRKAAFGLRRGELSSMQEKLQSTTAAAELALQIVSL